MPPNFKTFTKYHAKEWHYLMSMGTWDFSIIKICEYMKGQHHLKDGKEQQQTYRIIEGATIKHIQWVQVHWHLS